MKKYYEAYEERYKKIHSETGLAWAGDRPSPTLEILLKKYKATKSSTILEIGCGEGQNALNLISKGYNVSASDVSPEAIRWCCRQARLMNLPENRFFTLDVLNNNLKEKYDFIISVAVLHMLVEDEDRINFLKFINSHLNKNGKAFIIIMGDGVQTRKTDPNIAFDLADRPFGDKTVQVASTTCRMVTWSEFKGELKKAELNIVETFIDTTISGFLSSMVAVCESGK